MPHCRSPVSCLSFPSLPFKLSRGFSGCMEASLLSDNKRGIMDEEEELESMSSFYSEEDDSDRESMEDATSSSSSLSSCPPSSSSSSSLDDQLEEGSLFEMSSLISVLPIKRGLSKHFNGKSQSFTSLDNVRCLEDIVKPERPCNRRLSSCKSYGGGLDSHKALSPKASSRIITKKASSSSSSSSLLSARRHSLSSNRPPVCPPHRPSSLSGQMKFLCT
ncbi:unnamed protein product [Musa acuminata subsp. burmannicoides]